MRLSPAVQTLKPSATIAAAAKAKALKTQGINVYDFTLGEPDFNTPEHIQQAAIAAMKVTAPSTMTGRNPHLSAIAPSGACTRLAASATNPKRANLSPSRPLCVPTA